ncbi:MAG: CehA/McbA family metallohydrolase, partial [Pseudomonadota bacterium]
MDRLRIFLLALIAIASTAQAEWTNHYPQVQGFNHHVYLEGFELPILNAGPMDPAPSPDGQQVAFSARGWIWVMDIESRVARRITDSGAMDGRPAWSIDGEQLVFIRDNGDQLSIVSLNLASDQERILVETEAINLDPVFAADGQHVLYSSAEDGPLRLWQVNLATLERQTVLPDVNVGRRELERRPQVVADSNQLVFLSKRNSADSLALWDAEQQQLTRLVEDGITGQADLSVSPDGQSVAYIWPFDGGWELRMLSLAAPHTTVLLTQANGLPLAPAFSHDGQHVWFAEANDEERKALYRVSANGGAVEAVEVAEWDWGAAAGRLQLSTVIDDQPVPVRLNVLDANGHPSVPETGAVRSEGEHGRVFFYSDGQIELIGPAGEWTVSAVHGFETEETQLQVMVAADAATEATLALVSIWDASEHGWYSADTHFHLNYGGSYRLVPDDIITDLRAEGIDLGVPLLANLHNRFLEQELWGWRRDELPIIVFGQEVRSHFLGHVGLFGMDELFWPWIWGPGYELYANDDRLNAAPLLHAREGGGLGGYVHPVWVQNPLTEETASFVPISLVPDAVMGAGDWIEVGCLWTDEVGTAAVWHQILNLGIPLAATSGSDVMNNYYRTLTIGATRVYLRPDGAPTAANLMDALRTGRSFNSNGPMLEFQLGDALPGDVIAASEGKVEWTLTVHSALPIDQLE